MAKETDKTKGNGAPEDAAMVLAGELAISIKQIDKLISTARKTTKGWSTEKAIGHLLWHMFSKKGLCPICCLTQQFFRATRPEQARMRQRLPALFTHMLRKHGLFLLKDYAPFGNGTHGRVEAVGIYNPKTESPREKELAQLQLKRMVLRREITKEDAQLARELAGFLEDKSGEEAPV